MDGGIEQNPAYGAARIFYLQDKQECVTSGMRSLTPPGTPTGALPRKGMRMDHPQQTKTRSMIELLHRGLQEANEQGKAALEVEYKNVRDGVGVYIEGDKTSKGKIHPNF